MPLCMLLAWLLSVSLHFLDEVSWKHPLRWRWYAEKECSLDVHLCGSEEGRIGQREMLTIWLQLVPQSATQGAVELGWPVRLSQIEATYDGHGLQGSSQNGVRPCPRELCAEEHASQSWQR